MPTYVLPGPGRPRRAAATRRSPPRSPTRPRPRGRGRRRTGVDAAPRRAARTPRRPERGARSRSTCAPRRAPSASSRSTTPPASSRAAATEPRHSGCARSWAARTSGIPSVVVGSAPLDGAQRSRRADDAVEESRCSPAMLPPTSPRPASTTRRTGASAARSRRASPPGQRVPAARAAAVLDARLRAALGDRVRADARRGRVQPPDHRGADDVDVAVGRLDGHRARAGDVMSEPLLEGSRSTARCGRARSAGRSSCRRHRDRPGAAAVPVRARRTTGTPQPRSASWSVLPARPVPAVVGVLRTVCRPTSRSRRRTRGSGASSPPARRTSRPRAPPEIVLDARGHVVDDPRGIFCPLVDRLPRR